MKLGSGEKSTVALSRKVDEEDSDWSFEGEIG
jgi:hypothetical protein